MDTMLKNTTRGAMKPHTSSHKVGTLTAVSSKGTRIYQRNTGGTWTYKTKMGGKVRYFPLGLDKKEALELADTIRGHAMLYPIQEVLDMFQKKQFAKSKVPSPTIADVVQILEDSRISSIITILGSSFFLRDPDGVTIANRAPNKFAGL